jgi:sec-independent protein translocase protein TatA
MFRSPLIDAGVVLLAVLLIFGPKRLPQLGRGLGQGMREFKEGITGGSKDSDDDDDVPALPPGQPADVTQPVATPPAAERDTADVGSAEHRA